MPRLNLLNDFIFTKLMGEKGDEEQLLGFLNAVLRRTGKDKLVAIEIIECRQINAETIGNKTSILDIRARTDGGTRVNIELQLKNYGNMDRRSLFYWSREYVESIEAGQDYNELPNVIAINIIDFNFVGLDNFHTTFHLWEDSNKDYMLTDALEIHFIDMPKFRTLREKDVKNNALHRWLSYFDKYTPEDVRKELIAMDATIEKVEKKVSVLSADKETLHYYHMREMAESDLVSGLNFAKMEGLEEGKREGLEEGLQKGKKEGIEEGRRKEKMSTAKKLLAQGLSLDTIAVVTGLSESEIEDLRD